MPATLRQASVALPIAAAVVVAGVVPLLNTDTVFIGQMTIVLMYVLALIGMNVAMGYSGLLTLATGPIFGLGAYAAAIIDSQHVQRTIVTLPNGHRSLSFVPDETVLRMLLSIAGGTLIAALLGMLLLAPALRLGRSAYVMLSLYMAVALPTFISLDRFSRLTGDNQGLNGIRELVLPSDVNGDEVALAQQIYWIILVVVVAAYLISRRLILSHWGRAFVAVRDDETSAQSMGISPVRTKLLSLAVFSTFAACAGAIFAHANSSCTTTCTVNPGTFDVALAIFFFSALVVGGPASLTGPVLGAVVIGFFNLVAGNFSFGPISFTLDANQKDLVFGLLLLVSVVFVPGGVAGAARRGAVLLARWRDWRPAVVTAPSSTSVAVRPTLPAVGTHTGLHVDDVRVRFGGNVAVNSVGLDAAPRRIHALVGANGSGKTTLLNVISGVVAAERGTVSLDGRTLDGLASYRRARIGLGRTFQTPRVAVRLTVLENVLQGAFPRYRTGWIGLYAALWRRAREDRTLRQEALHLLDAVGLGARAGQPAESLTHGERRLLEVARALINGPRVLLLDEPAAGLADDEIEDLANLVIAAKQAGSAVVLVEHNLAFVRRVADDATVLERGRIIASGTPADALSQPQVIESFVGAAA